MEKLQKKRAAHSSLHTEAQAHFLLGETTVNHGHTLLGLLSVQTLLVKT